MNSIPAIRMAPIGGSHPGNAKGGATPGGERKRILILDDSPVVLRALSGLLHAHGYEVLTAQDGGDGISMVRQHRPDLILLDLMFPPDVAHGGGVPWDGFLILSWLQRMDEAKDTPVIIITGTDPASYKDRKFETTVKGILRKPIEQDQLLAAIAETFAPANANYGPTEQALAAKRILFVDDETDWRFMASEYLKDAGYEVLTAKDGSEALSHLAQARLDLVILDLNLGEESGLDLLQQLKQVQPDVPVLIYTGMEHDYATVRGMLDQGAYQYLRKGTLGEMLTSVQGAMAGVTA